MKIMFYFNWGFAYLCHELAKKFKGRHCGIAIGKHGHDFLKNQNDVKYAEIAFMEDIHRLHESEAIDMEYLNKLESKYGNLWHFAYADRDIINSGHEAILKMLQSRFKFYTSFIERNKPDMLLMNAVASMDSLMVYHIAKKNSVNVIIIQPSRIKLDGKVYYTKSNAYDIMEAANKRLAELNNGSTSKRKKDAERFISQFREEQSLQEIVQFKKKTDKIRLFEMPFKFLRYSKEYYFGKYKNNFSVDSPIKIASNSISKSIKKKTQKHLFDAPNQSDNFALFPLAVQPEASTAILAQYCMNQPYVIENISKSLSSGMLLYVKEHPTAYGTRTNGFYRQIKKLKNVRLISPYESTHHLIKQSKLIITISSTAGWEALLYNKPAITFGSTFYNILNSTTKCKSFNELPQLIRSPNKVEMKEITNFISAILENSFEMPLEILWSKERERQAKITSSNINPLYNFIKHACLEVW